jgi:transposase-like protein
MIKSEDKYKCPRCGKLNRIKAVDGFELDSAQYKCKCGYSVYNAEYGLKEAFEGIIKKLEVDLNEKEN